MFGMNKQTMYVISNVGSTVVSKKAVEDIYVKPVVIKPVVINTPVFKTRGEAKAESIAKKVVVDVLVAEVRIKPKKTFWQKLFCVSQYN